MYECKNYRGISLLSKPERNVLERVTKITVCRISEEQGVGVGKIDDV